MAEINTEIGYLMRLAEDHSAESRNKLLAIIKDLFENKSDVLSDREKHLMFGIIEALVQEVEVSIHQQLSQQLADRDDLPEALVTYLANDEIAVAFPILSRCASLRDADLIKIIHHRTEEHLLAITLRQQISTEISDALVKSGSEDVIINLLNNENSEISASTREYLVEQSNRIDSFQDPLVRRHDLSTEMAEKLYGWVSNVLKHDIAAKFDLSDAVLKKIIVIPKNDQPKKRAASENSLSEAMLGLIKQLRAKNLVTPTVMVAALKQGEIPLFLGLFVELTGLDLDFVKSIVFDSTGEEIAVACKAIGTTEIQFATILRITRKQTSLGQADLSQDRVNKMLTFFRTMELENAKRAINAWASLTDEA